MSLAATRNLQQIPDACCTGAQLPTDDAVLDTTITSLELTRKRKLLGLSHEKNDGVPQCPLRRRTYSLVDNRDGGVRIPNSDPALHSTDALLRDPSRGTETTGFRPAKCCWAPVRPSKIRNRDTQSRSRSDSVIGPSFSILEKMLVGSS